MDITIPKSLEALVRRKVDEGHYSTEDEVVADALRLMQARDDVAEIKRARLKDAIERGYQDAAAGKVIRMIVPRCSVLSISSSALCRRTMPYTIASPSPVPRIPLVVKNGSRQRRRVSSSMPIPPSATSSCLSAS